MLCINNYSQKYIDECRSKLELQLSSYQNLLATARKQAGDETTQLKDAIASFEPDFFNNMVLLLDNFFSNRSRMMELKDGNPLNEVRMLCNAILNNNITMVADKTIRYNPEKSVLKYKTGDKIKLSETEFLKLYTAFFAEIEMKYL